MKKSFDRRSFLRTGAMAGLGLAIGDKLLALNPSVLPYTSSPLPITLKPLNKVRIGYVGVGGMGTAHVNNLLKIEAAEIVAVGDIVPERVERAQRLCEAAGKTIPEGYSKGEYDFKRMCERDDIDLIYTATPWRWHVPVCLEAMNSGKHAATEVPAAVSIDECWQLVETSESTGKHCIMMENCNYDRAEMMILNIVHQGLLGELVHAECGYLHDLRAVKFDMNGEGVWRRQWSVDRNADLYPTHGLAPVAQCMNINRGNYFDYLASFSSKTRGLHQYALREYGVDSPYAEEQYILGDVVTTIIRTMNEETIIVTHDTSLPRPYSRDIKVQGTKGLVRKYPEPKIYIEGKSQPHRWEDLSEYKEAYMHPVWVELEEKSKGAGHGGMDFIEDYRLINALLKGNEPDMDVYDAAVISAVVELSEQSITQNGQPVKFPDFTRGMWKKPRILPVNNEQSR